MKSATLVSRIPQTSNSSARQYPKIAPRPSTSHAQNVGYIISGATFGPNTQFVDANGNPVMFVQAGSSDETIVTHSYTQPVQYPSLSHAYSSASTSQHEFNEFVRSCPECKEKFPTLKALKSHIDKCLITSFENEVINTMTSLPNLQLEGDYDSSFIHRPLLEDEMGSPELATMEPIRQEHRYDTEPTDIFDDFPELESNFNDIDDTLESQTSGSPADFDLKPSPKRLAQIRKRKLAEDIKLSQLNGFRDRINDDILLVENTQTVESRKGLKLLVSVKRPKIIKSEQIPGPSSSMEQEEDDELDILQRPSTSKNEDLLETGVNRTRYKVIGALANADTTANDVKMECPTCGLRLYKHNFSAHYRIHTGDLPYDCKYCDKKFRTTSAQKVHMRCHTGEKPYQCPKCPYACITKRNLDRHIINNHVRKNADGTTNQPRFRKSKYYRPETDFRIETGQEEPEEYFVMYDANNFNEALEAVENNDLRKLKRILNHYLVRAQDQEGTSILRYAVMKGRQDIVNYLLESYGDSLRDQIEEIPAKE